MGARVLGHYRLLDLVGAGGMGAVYRARIALPHTAGDVAGRCQLLGRPRHRPSSGCQRRPEEVDAVHDGPAAEIDVAPEQPDQV